MTDAARIAGLIAVLSTGVVYGTDVFCALVQRPALARVDDRALTTVMETCIVTVTGECRYPGRWGSLRRPHPPRSPGSRAGGSRPSLLPPPWFCYWPGSRCTGT